jgi:hypothetical protein
MTGPTYVTVNKLGEARMDFENFQDDKEDDLTIALSVPNSVNVTITPATGRIELVGQAAIIEGHGSVASSATATLTTEPKAADEPLLAPEEPPSILWAPLARLFLSPTQYKAWESHIADMHYERDQCLKRGDVRAARWAVVRAHVYSVPHNLWRGVGLALLWLARHWVGF